jgi:hypothetical protein
MVHILKKHSMNTKYDETIFRSRIDLTISYEVALGSYLNFSYDCIQTNV